MMNIRTNHELRIEAYDSLISLKNNGVPRKAMIDKIKTELGIPRGTLYDWYKGKYRPHGRKGEIKHCQELFYVLGALLGDGCIYNWKTTQNYTILVGDRKFAVKYASMLRKCIGTSVKPYIDRSKNIWFVRTNNFILYSLFKKMRENLTYMKRMIRQSGKISSVLFLEGFFDAEGCVKIIKEKTRKTPKICLDICNTNYEILELIRKILKKQLNIDAHYSSQAGYLGKDGHVRKKSYHLRIYKKEFVRKFFCNISTLKLKQEKIKYVNNRLNNGK